jgi:hypothetical protein
MLLMTEDGRRVEATVDDTVLYHNKTLDATYPARIVGFSRLRVKIIPINRKDPVWVKPNLLRVVL